MPGLLHSLNLTIHNEGRVVIFHGLSLTFTKYCISIYAAEHLGGGHNQQLSWRLLLPRLSFDVGLGSAVLTKCFMIPSSSALFFLLKHEHLIASS